MRSSQLLIFKGQEQGYPTWRVTMLAETATDSINNAAERVLEELAGGREELKSRLTYRKQVIAESYLLGTVRAIHNITFNAAAEEAVAFFGALKNGIDALTRNNPSFRILEEDPKEWWLRPRVDHRLTGGQGPSNNLNTAERLSARSRVNNSSTTVCEMQKKIRKGESFKWTPTIEFYRDESGGGRLYRCRAITATLTGNNNKFTREELILAARSLADRPINLNHEQRLPYPDNKTLDAEYESHGVETIIRVRDEETNRLFDEDRIRHVSIEAHARREEERDGIAPIGLVFIGLALLTDDVLPADPATTIELWEKAGEVSLAKIEEPGWFAKFWEKTDLPNQLSKQQTVQQTSESSDKTKAHTVDSKRKAPNTSNVGGRVSTWLLVGITAFLVLIWLIAKTFTRKSRLSLEAKQAIAKQHVALHSGVDARTFGQREVSSGTEFEFEAARSKFTVVVDDLGQVRSWRQTK